MLMRPQSEPDRFTGEAGFRVLHVSTWGSSASESPARQSGRRGEGTWNSFAANVSMVRYETGVRTHWHSHSGGQVLYIVEGEGWVQSRGDEAHSVGPGDAVSFAPGEVHWHGAKVGRTLAHVTFTMGRPTWFEEAAAPPG